MNVGLCYIVPTRTISRSVIMHKNEQECDNRSYTNEWEELRTSVEGPPQEQVAWERNELYQRA
jgi:hypothetical protein